MQEDSPDFTSSFKDPMSVCKEVYVELNTALHFAWLVIFAVDSIKIGKACLPVTQSSRLGQGECIPLNLQDYDKSPYQLEILGSIQEHEVGKHKFLQLKSSNYFD